MTRNLFERRIQIKPYEYPELLEFKDAIRHSYWLHTEFNFTGDIQDYKTVITPRERTALTRAMLAISQVEVSVKRFWGDLYRYFPKPEIDERRRHLCRKRNPPQKTPTPSSWKNSA